MSALLQRILALSPVGYWPMDEASGTTVNDRSGNSRNGSLQGATPPTIAGSTFLDGRPCITFPGVDTLGRVEVADNTAFEIPTTGLLSAGVWFYLTTEDAAAATLISKRENNTGTEFEWILREVTAGNGLNGQVTNSAAADAADATGGTIELSRWHFAGASMNDTANELFVYLDGVLVASDTSWTGTLSGEAAVLCFGAWKAGAMDQCFAGRMAHGFVTADVVTAEEWTNVYQAGIRSGVSF